jgi:polyhydroxyalkanoate synthesis regulator phasin
MKCLIHLIVILSIVKKGKKMTEEEFKKALDEVVLKGINELGASTVLGALAVVSRFTEVVYDMDVVARLQAIRESKAEVQEVEQE